MARFCSFPVESKHVLDTRDSPPAWRADAAITQYCKDRAEPSGAVLYRL